MLGSSQMVRMPNVQASFVIAISSLCLTDATPSDRLVKVFEALAVLDIQESLRGSECVLIINMLECRIHSKSTLNPS